jgi:nucleoside-diphosphate-sugar epimerase
VIRKLVSLSSYDIIVIVRNPAKLEKVLRKEYLKNLKIIQGDLLKYEDIKFIEKQLRILNPDIKIVINLVGGGPLTINYNIENEIMDLNFTTLKNLVKILINSNKLNNVKIFIHLSSLAAAGALNPEGRFHESMMCYPVLPYERAKYLGEVF